MCNRAKSSTYMNHGDDETQTQNLLVLRGKQQCWPYKPVRQNNSGFCHNQEFRFRTLQENYQLCHRKIHNLFLKQKQGLWQQSFPQWGVLLPTPDFFLNPPFLQRRKGDSPLGNYLPSKNESPPTEKRTPPLLKNEASSHEMIPRNKIQMWETPIDSVSLRKQIKKLTVILKNIRSCLEQTKFHKESEIVGKYCIT